MTHRGPSQPLPFCDSVIVQEANLEKVHLAVKANRLPSELDTLGAQLMDDIIADCRYFLPVLTEPFHAVYGKSSYLSWKGRLLLFSFFLSSEKRRSFANVCFQGCRAKARG